VLLDQSIVAGGGLIFVLETLFRAGLSPTTPARTIDRTPGVHCGRTCAG
jgi:formamidopyrimidine-DNA glycosylase